MRTTVQLTVLHNVDASVVKSQKAPLLLGQSAMERFGTITIDNQNNKLIIKHQGMSLDYWHLSMATVQLALRNHDYEYRPSGTAEIKFRVGKDWYYINCAKLPCVFIQRFQNARSYLGVDFSIVDIFSALNAVNDKLHLVKASREDENLVAFTLCLREDRYLVFKENLIEDIRELDDAVESFGMAAILLREEEKEEMMKDYIDRMMNAEDDMYKEKRIQS